MIPYPHKTPLIVLVGVLLLSGCSSTNWLPPAHQWRDAAIDSLKDPHVWMPLAGAALFSIDDYDQKISNSAVEHTPVFGSVEDAESASDDLRGGLQAAALISALLVPESVSQHSRLKRVVVEVASSTLVNKTTTFIKGEANRTRPNRQNRESFPSGHASQAFAGAMLTSHNIRAMPYFSDTTKTYLHCGLMTLATGGAWARVEAQKHYPSDVLFSAALANFITDYSYRLFLSEARNDEVVVKVIPVGPEGEGWGIQLDWWY